MVVTSLHELFVTKRNLEKNNKRCGVWSLSVNTLIKMIFPPAGVYIEEFTRHLLRIVQETAARWQHVGTTRRAVGENKPEPNQLNFLYIYI
jgi:hypothetical protein